jgi:hypothetical protein
MTRSIWRKKTTKYAEIARQRCVLNAVNIIAAISASRQKRVGTPPVLPRAPLAANIALSTAKIVKLRPKLKAITQRSTNAA